MTIIKALQRIAAAFVPVLAFLACSASPALATGPPTVAGESATGVTESGATIQAEVNPEGLETSVYVEYASGGFGAPQYTAPVSVGAGEAVQNVSFPLTGLQPGTTYRFRVFAFNMQGPVEGKEMSFNTHTVPPPIGASPWWGLTSSALPTNVHAGAGKDEAQEIITTGEVVFILQVEGKLVEIFESEPYAFAAFPHATAANVQAALEKAALSGEISPAFGAGNVRVTGQGTEGTPPLVATSIGQYAEFTVPPVEVLHGLGAGTVEAKVVQEAQADGTVSVMAENLGDAEVDGAGAPVTLSDELPPGLEAIKAQGSYRKVGDSNGTDNVDVPLQCAVASARSVNCSFTEALPPYKWLEMIIPVRVAAGAASGANEVTAVGGDAPARSVRQAVTVSGEQASFGLESFGFRLENEGGSPDTQAGSHPFQLTNTVAFNETADPRKPPATVKDLHFELPPGLVGNPTPLPRCTDLQFGSPSSTVSGNQCPADTAIGVASATISLHGVSTFVVPLFNLTPEVGEPARFGFLAEGNPVILDTSVRTGGDYGVTVSVDNITQDIAFISSRVTFWGVPGDPRHDASRGWACVGGGEDLTEHSSCTPQAEANPPPLVILPTSCTGPLQTSVQADSWAQSGSFLTFSPEEPLQSLDGCNRLNFEPSIKVTPDAQQASKPTGLNVDVHVPQEASLNSTGLAESEPKDITVALPEGVAINPAGGDGLEACSEGLVGFTGLNGEINPGSDTATFTPTPKAPEESATPGINTCGSASKIGEVTIHTPLLPNPLKGFVYLAAQEQNPFGSLLAMYLVAEDPVSGTLVKLAGQVHLTETGQIVTTFENNPQLPFEDAELHFYGGERAPLASPAHCGAYTTNAAFTPWSEESNPAHPAPYDASSTFDITSGPATTAHPGGTPCPGSSLPFEPTSTGGATNVNAAAFSPLTTTFSREPGEQNLQSAEVKLPPGLSGLLSSVELCREPQANLGTCGPNSLIGETTVSVGVGGDPFTVKGGRVYITGPYNGTRECTVGETGCAPFGLSVTDPAKAGPYDLANTKNSKPPCDCILVRAKIEINPKTTALTITSNPPGSPYAIPTSIEGIPLQIQHVNITTTRSAFQFNPTNCDKTQFEATLRSAEGGIDTIKIPFQVTNCAALAFAPKFAVSTSGKTSKAKGASLSVKLTYPKAPFGSQANIKSVKVDLPKQLPSRLTTLQKACTAKQFDTNPAGCPPASIVGHAKAITPLIPVPLEGPAYFVSNGSEAFPNLIVVLQGYGVTVELVGDTFISKAGITSSTFKAVPDQPVGSFELTLPEGKFSALAANGNLCAATKTVAVRKRVARRVHGRLVHVLKTVKQTVAQPLSMPTAFTAQSGAVLKQSTNISVTGCGKAKPTKHKPTRHKPKKA